MRLKRPEDYYIKILLQEVKVKDVMTSPVISLNVDAPFSRVDEIFREKGIRHLPIVSQDNTLVGLVTQRDLYRIASPRTLLEGGWYYDKEMLDQIILARVMNDHPAVAYPEDSVAQALLTMVEGKYGCLVVIEGKQKLCGILTQVDILKIAAQILQES